MKTCSASRLTGMGLASCFIAACVFSADSPDGKDRKERPSASTTNGLPTIATPAKPAVSEPRRGPVAMNVIGMPQGAYSKKMFGKIGRCWTLMLDQYYADGQPGVVKLGFTLYPDGRVGNVKVLKNTASSILEKHCQKAVTDSAPFDAWPQELKLLGGDHLDITIDFNVYLYER